MGKYLCKKAEELGITQFPVTVLYARPRTLRQIFSTVVSDTADTIRDYIKVIDPSFIQGRAGGTRNTSHYYLAPRALLYVEFVDKTAGVVAINPGNHVNKISIFSKFKAHVINIAVRLDAIFPGGMLAHMDWDKIETKFLVQKNDCITTWNALLNQVIKEKQTPEELQQLEAERNEFDHEVKLIEKDEKEKADNFRRLLDKYRD